MEAKHTETGWRQAFFAAMSPETAERVRAELAPNPVKCSVCGRTSGELYEALRGLLAYAEQLELVTYDGPERPIHHMAMDCARAAIAKAEGK